ncbi:MAG: Uma2 family endonuclease [Chloroflexota bacterium]
MIESYPLSDAEALLLTTPNDTEEAPWMTMPDFQWRVIALLMSILRRHMGQHNLPWYLAAELKVIMPRQVRAMRRKATRRTLDLGPDLLMAEADDIERTSWNVRVEGRPPALVLEVATEDSWERDTEDKPLLYDLMGVTEYVIFAPQRKSAGPKLFGYQRNEDGRFVAWHADAEGMLRSEVLGGLHLYVEDDKWLRVRDEAGNRLLSDKEAALLEAQRAEQEAAARQAAEARALEAERRAAAVEAELARLRAERP